MIIDSCLVPDLIVDSEPKVSGIHPIFKSYIIPQSLKGSSNTKHAV